MGTKRGDLFEGPMSNLTASVHRIFISFLGTPGESAPAPPAPATASGLSSEQEEAILRNMAEGIAVCDPHGQVIHMNPAALELYACSLEEVMGHSVKELPGIFEVTDLANHPIPLEQWPISRALKGERFKDYEVHLRRKDSGKEWYASYAGTPICDDSGRFLFAVVTMRDVTHLKKAQAELAEAKAAADRSNAAKDEFLAVLSHELRIPLTPVLTAAQLLQRRKDLPEDVVSHLQMMSRNIGLEVRLIDDLLDLTKISRGKVNLKREHVALGTIVQKVIELCAADLEARKLHINIDLRDHPLWVDGDPSRLQQILWNLLKNSIKFTPEGGSITLWGRLVGDQVVVDVIDTGIGIEPEALGRIFGAFEQGDRKVTTQFGGLGLGLAITKKLVEMHEGSICAHSEGKGRGATFVVALPKGHPPEGALDAERNEAKTGHHARILLVEDHADTAQMMSEVLRCSGYDVETASDIGAALHVVKEKPFDLLVSDLGLPDGSGLDLMSELQKQGRSLRSIALSGFGQDEDMEKSKAAGFREHLTKPVDVDALLAAVDRLAAGPA